MLRALKQYPARLTLTLVILATSPSPALSASDATTVRVIRLTQLPCQFLQSEAGINLGYSSTQADDCKQINAASADNRLKRLQPLRLKPGKYRFRVTNKNVPYPLGFWLRGEGLIGRATLPSVSGGGLTKGTTRDYEIELKPGNYRYSCPLNPTPDYALIVSE